LKQCVLKFDLLVHRSKSWSESNFEVPGCLFELKSSVKIRAVSFHPSSLFGSLPIPFIL